ncbi:MAG: hypothetical protein LBL58_17770 [Tannerellaceae bacterium]|nr:hypothetical protein [Tannerellaceae bacterium]
MKKHEGLRMSKMTAVVFRRNCYTARMGINYGDYASPRPYVTITDDKNIFDKTGKAVNFEKTDGSDKMLRYEIMSLPAASGGVLNPTANKSVKIAVRN